MFIRSLHLKCGTVSKRHIWWSYLCHVCVTYLSECHVCVIWLSSACLSLLSLLHFTTVHFTTMLLICFSYASHMLLICFSSDVIGLLSWPQWSAPCGDAKEVPPGEVEQSWRKRRKWRKWRKWRRKMASKTETKLRSLQVKTSIAATISISRAIQRVRTNHLLPFLQEQGNSRNMERLSSTHLRSSQDAFGA